MEENRTNKTENEVKGELASALREPLCGAEDTEDIEAAESGLLPPMPTTGW